MPLDSLKSPLLDMYYLATLPQRKRSAQSRAEAGQVPVIALFYHRVADEHPNDWTIGNDLFQAQVKWVRERFEIVSLLEAQRRIAAEENTRPTVTITFDDGYADNCDVALPWLLEHRIPFTYFVASGHVAANEPFEHDLRAGQPLPPNTPEQLKELSDAGVEIGAHTRSHADLGRVADEAKLFDEIVGSQRDLEAIIDRPVRYFAFPFGMPENLSTTAFRVAHEAGLWGVCSAYGDYNFPGDDSFHIQRIHGDPEWGRFRNWLTVDPRKLDRPKQFDPGDYRNRF